MPRIEYIGLKKPKPNFKGSIGGQTFRANLSSRSTGNVSAPLGGNCHCSPSKWCHPIRGWDPKQCEYYPVVQELHLERRRNKCGATRSVFGTRTPFNWFPHKHKMSESCLRSTGTYHLASDNPRKLAKQGPNTFLKSMLVNGQAFLKNILPIVWYFVWFIFHIRCNIQWWKRRIKYMSTNETRVWSSQPNARLEAWFYKRITKVGFICFFFQLWGHFGNVSGLCWVPLL